MVLTILREAISKAGGGDVQREIGFAHGAERGVAMRPRAKPGIASESAAMHLIRVIERCVLTLGGAILLFC